MEKGIVCGVCVCGVCLREILIVPEVDLFFFFRFDDDDDDRVTVAVLY